MTGTAQPQDTAATPSPRPADEARTLVRRGLKAALATLTRPSGDPHVSLVTVATNARGAPLLLISKLALHTQNLLADSRASLLFDGTSAIGDPLAGGRVTLAGRVQATAAATERRRFLARHPEAEIYADFPDFGFYTLEIERAHFIGGFGRIVSLQPSDLLLDLTGAEALLEAESDIAQHMNADHADALALYAIHRGLHKGGTWRMTGLDPEGFDAVSSDGSVARIPFAQRVLTPNAARLEFVRMAADARAAANGSGIPPDAT